MRQALVILCLLLNLSTTLLPFNDAHAHIASPAQEVDEFVGVHGGHSHDLDGNHIDDTPDPGLVIDMQPVLTAQPSFQSTFWSHWLPLACVVVLLLAAEVCISFVPRPRSDRKPISQDGYWRPPLRGPPALSIHTI